VTAGNNRRSSTAAENSPRCSKAARIAAASASVTTIMPAGWRIEDGKLTTEDGKLTTEDGKLTITVFRSGAGERDLLAQGARIRAQGGVRGEHVMIDNARNRTSPMDERDEDELFTVCLDDDGHPVQRAVREKLERLRQVVAQKHPRPS
jgi:hypothetical protein